jgi:hypothetical protein
MSTQLDQITQKAKSSRLVSATWGARCGKSARRVLSGGMGSKSSTQGPSLPTTPPRSLRSLVLAPNDKDRNKELKGNSGHCHSGFIPMSGLGAQDDRGTYFLSTETLPHFSLSPTKCVLAITISVSC